MRIRIRWGVLVALAVAHASSAQSIRIAERTRIVAQSQGRPLTEPHLAISPSDPRRMLVGVIVGARDSTYEASRRRQTCRTYSSADGGRTWREGSPELTACYDPWVAITPRGQAVFTALGAHRTLPQQPEGLAAYYSPDGGESWNPAPAGLGRSHDHPMTAVDTSAGPRRGWLYAVSSHSFFGGNGILRHGILVARSRSAGRFFDPPVLLTPSNLMIKAETPLVLPDGSLVVPFVDAARNENDWQDGELARRRAWMVRSTDGGFTFSIPSFIMDDCGGGPHFTLSAAAAGRAEPDGGDLIYFACNGPGPLEIRVALSVTQGETWNDPISLPAGQAGGAVTWRVVRGMTVNSRGVLGVVWSERAGPDHDCYDAFFTALRPGSETFLPPVRLTAARSCPPAGVKGRAWPSAGGDYYGIAAAADGTFRVVWAEADAAAHTLWTASLAVGSGSGPADAAPAAAGCARGGGDGNRRMGDEPVLTQDPTGTYIHAEHLPFTESEVRQALQRFVTDAEAAEGAAWLARSAAEAAAMQRDSEAARARGSTDPGETAIPSWDVGDEVLAALRCDPALTARVDAHFEERWRRWAAQRTRRELIKRGLPPGGPPPPEVQRAVRRALAPQVAAWNRRKRQIAALISAMPPRDTR